MAMTNETERERKEREFRNHINGIVKERADKMQEQFNEAFAKAAAEAKRNRTRRLTRELVRCSLAIVCIACLYLAESAGLISSVLTAPAYAIASTDLGWHLCRADRIRGRR